MKSPAFSGQELKAASIQLIPYLVILLTIVTFNIISVVGLKTLIKDDIFRYWFNSLSGNYLDEGLLSRSLAGPFIHAVFYFLFNKSLVLARLLALMAMVALSFMYYHFAIRYLKLPKLVSLVSAIIPNIIPGNLDMVTYLDGSYPLWGLMFLLASFIAGFKYLEKESASHVYLALYSVLYFIASQSMNELAVFFFPVILVLFCQAKRKSRYLWLVASTTLFVLIKIYQATSRPLGSINSPQSFDVAKVASRLKIMFSKWITVVNVNSEYFAVIVAMSLAISFSALLIVFIDSRKSDVNRYVLQRGENFYFAYLILFVWFSSTSVVFLTVSLNFMARYFYAASYAFNTIMALSLYVIMAKLFLRMNAGRHFLVVALSVIYFVIILSSGFAKQRQFKEQYEPLNRLTGSLVELFEERKFPVNSQIVVLTDIKRYDYVGKKLPRSRGFIRLCSGRKDLDGLVGEEISFSDSFAPLVHGGWGNIMSGISEEYPVFIFREKDFSLDQIEYALRWRGTSGGAGGDNWSLMKMNKSTGGHELVAGGDYLDEFENTVIAMAEAGIFRNDIAWAKKPNEEDIKKIRDAQLFSAPTKDML